MDISAVKQGLADAAAAAAGDTGLTCLPYVPDAPTPPCFFAGEVDIDYTSPGNTFGHGVNDVTVACRILVGRADDRASQALLDRYLSGGVDLSLRDAIEADGTLGGACSDVHVTAVRAYQFHEHSGTRYIGADLAVRVVGPGS